MYFQSTLDVLFLVRFKKSAQFKFEKLHALSLFFFFFFKFLCALVYYILATA